MDLTNEELNKTVDYYDKALTNGLGLTKRTLWDSDLRELLEGLTKVNVIQRGSGGLAIEAWKGEEKLPYHIVVYFKN